MFVFGINLPVAEILFVTLLLFIIAMVFIVIQLLRMGKHIKVLDETTLEIRRYEEAEETTLRAQEMSVTKLAGSEKRRVQEAGVAMAKLETKALVRLLEGAEPAALKSALQRNGVTDGMATRAVNNATYLLDRVATMEPEDAKALVRAAARR